MDSADFLAHRHGDDVAVAVRDISPGPVVVAYLDSDDRVTLTALEPIALGHKVAVRDLDSDFDVTEYGACIGRTYKPVRKGEAVHIHNLRSVRWPRSS